MILSYNSILPLLLCAVAVIAQTMEKRYNWETVDYIYPDEDQHKTAIESKRFIPENCIIMDVDVFIKKCPNSAGKSCKPEEQVFVTIPNIKPGNPATVAKLVVETESDPLSPMLSPFPNWSYYTVQEDLNFDNTIVSVYRIKIDEFDRMWFVDTCTENQFDVTQRSICNPKLFIFDLNNEYTLLLNYKFPTENINHNSLYTNIVVDIKECKDDAFAYIADTTGYELLVYDLKNNASWVVQHAYFYPYPNNAFFDINDVKFSIMDGVIGLALNSQLGDERSLYFHSSASKRESWVHTKFLQNKDMFENGLIDSTDIFHLSAEARPFQSTVEVMTDEGILISTSMDNSLNCWNSSTKFTYNNIHEIYKNDTDLQFPSGLKIIGLDKLWVVSNKLQNEFTTNPPISEDPIRCRVLVGDIAGLLKDKRC